MVKLLCVYCSSSRDLAPGYHEAAEAVGRGMVERGWGSSTAAAASGSWVRSRGA